MLVKNLAGDADKEGRTGSDLGGSNSMAATAAKFALLWSVATWGQLGLNVSLNLCIYHFTKT